MAVLPIVTYPDPRLKIPSEKVDEVDDTLRMFMDDMLETMYANEGVGLAAVQVGIHKRILVCDISRGSKRYGTYNESKSTPVFMINPEITWSSEEDVDFDEGCLSFPGQYSSVTRPEFIKVKFLDYDGKEQEIKAEGILSRCIQHEIDHLDGITFVDHISRLKRNMITKKLKKAKR